MGQLIGYSTPILHLFHTKKMAPQFPNLWCPNKPPTTPLTSTHPGSPFYTVFSSEKSVSHPVRQNGCAMNQIWVVSPRTSDEEKGSSVRWQILLLLGTRLCTSRSYYSKGLVCLPTELGSPMVNGLTDHLQSCRSYSPCRCLTACPICLGDSAL